MPQHLPAGRIQGDRGIGTTRSACASLTESRRGIVPTPIGLALKKRSVAIFNDLRQSVQDIDFLSDPTTGELRIGTTDPLGVAIVSPCIDRLSRKHQRMSFHAIAGDTTSRFTES